MAESFGGTHQDGYNVSCRISAAWGASSPPGPVLPRALPTGPPQDFGFVPSLYGLQQLASTPPIHGFKINLPQPFIPSFNTFLCAPPQEYSFPFGGLQGPAFPLGQCPSGPWHTSNGIRDSSALQCGFFSYYSCASWTRKRKRKTKRKSSQALSACQYSYHAQAFYIWRGLHVVYPSGAS